MANRLRDYPVEDLIYQQYFIDSQGNVRWRGEVSINQIPAKNSLEISITELSASSRKKITTPDGASDFKIAHYEYGERIYIGDENVTSSTGLPIEYGSPLPLDGMKAGDDNDLYAISEKALKVYAYGKVST